MNSEIKGIWELRREKEKSTGREVEIYSAYPVIGRGSIHHGQVSHLSVEKGFEAALTIPRWKRIVYFINQKISHA